MSVHCNYYKDVTLSTVSINTLRQSDSVPDADRWVGMCHEATEAVVPALALNVGARLVRHRSLVDIPLDRRKLAVCDIHVAAGSLLLKPVSAVSG